MMRPPIEPRRDAPRRLPNVLDAAVLFWNLTSNALPKFCPRSWLVPAWSALPSCIIASMQKLETAPANFSLSVFLPRMTGIAMTSSAKSA